MKLNDYIDNRRQEILNLKTQYHKIKSIIHEFEKECEKNIVFKKKVFIISLTK